jgi:excisionase family DNA binding protein
MPPFLNLDGAQISLDALTREQLIALAVDVFARLTAPAPAPAAPSNPITRLLTVSESATRLRCGRAHVYEPIRAGELATVRHGTSIIVRESAVEDFINRHETPGAVYVGLDNVLRSQHDRRRAQATPRNLTHDASGSAGRNRRPSNDRESMGTRDRCDPGTSGKID